VLIIVVVTAVVLLSGVMAVAWVRGRLLLNDRTRLDVRARQLAAEAQIAAVTRRTVQAMRDSVYRSSRP
jgi:hypothetical protein